jgi:hypothetical protein
MGIEQLRVVAAAAVVSGLSAAGVVYAEEKLGLSTLQRRLRSRRR